MPVHQEEWGLAAGSLFLEGNVHLSRLCGGRVGGRTLEPGTEKALSGKFRCSYYCYYYFILTRESCSPEKGPTASMGLRPSPHELRPRRGVPAPPGPPSAGTSARGLHQQTATTCFPSHLPSSAPGSPRGSRCARARGGAGVRRGGGAGAGAEGGGTRENTAARRPGWAVSRRGR